MKIEIWSDFVCPFCYLGKRRLEMALDQFPHQEHVKIEFKSYELDPHAEKDYNMNYFSLLANKYEMTIEKARMMTEEVQKQAQDIGLAFNFELMQPTNTFDAHRLVKYAMKQGKDNDMVERILKAYFIQSENIGNHVTLENLAYDIGLDRDEVESVLVTNAYARAVRDDEDEARQLGVQGVPFFVFNEMYAVSGAQPPEVFLEVLEKIWADMKDHPERKLSMRGSETTYCCGDDCD